MNIRQGLFRLWVVVSLLWVCLIGFIVSNDARKYLATRQLTVDGNVLEISGTTSRIAVKAELLQLFKRQKINGAILTASEAEETATESSQKFTSKDFPEFLFEITGVMLLVPAVLLVFGSLLLWIGAGFRRQSSQ